jgi:hypothetical protein
MVVEALAAASACNLYVGARHGERRLQRLLPFTLLAFVQSLLKMSR